jgi:hypothetical protein
MKKLTTKKLLLALVVTGLAGVSAQAQIYQNSFDNSGSIVGRFDYGSATSISAASWSSLDAQGNPSSGSELITYTLNTTADGTAQAAETLDLLYPGQNVGDLSFDMMIGTGSAVDLYGGYGDFKVTTRLTDNYNSQTALENELGPSWGLPLTAGQWVHIDIPLNSTTGTAVRALTLQEYSGSDRNINGNEYIYIDNLTMTAVPEPTMLALAGLGAAGLMIFRRRK